MTEKEPNRLKGVHGHHIQTKVHKGQGLAAPPKFKSWILKIKNSPDVSGSDSLIFLTVPLFKFLTASQPRPFFKASATKSRSVQLLHLSPLKQFPVKDDLLAYGVKGRKAIIYKNSHFALHKDLPSVSSQARFQSMGRKKGMETLETALIALRSRDEHRLNSIDLCGTFYQGKVPRWSAIEDKRNLIIAIASAELGIKESTGNNDGPRIDNSLRLAQPRPFFKASATSSICTISRNVAFDIFKNLKEDAQSIVLKISSDEFLLTFCGKKYEPRHGLSGIIGKHFAIEDKRNLIIAIASAELGVKESTGNNDGPRVDNSLGLAQPRPFYSASATRTPLQSGLMSPVKLLTIAEGSTTVQSKGSSDKAWTLGRYQVSRPSGMEDKRNLIIAIASAELGVKESTGNNDGPRIEQYLAYTGLTKGYEWCAAFVSWCYGQSGLSQPRNPWSPALFPKAKSYKDTDKIQPADLFGIYSSSLRRIHHVGLIKERQGQFILTIEGNSNDRVESRRRHVRTVYGYADWVGES
ncbi:hypothetical protein M472_08390 [Sphingobacterium paucimobilis HER1398]|uniref:Peptidase C51 domain-containing protein n=1 Tax=Sphingobacterium paucimobilis HER1398 TaxID=1346330 RepID=U2HU28_9SPHI|nr:hypothetical protein M472_08390 [Sphingobacterium paucimobilis HER1398]